MPILTFLVMLYYELGSNDGSLDDYNNFMVLVLVAKQTYFFDK